MKFSMRVPILLLCSTFFCNFVHADPLSDADREALLANLEKIRDASNSKTDARFRIALAAYRNAMSSDDAAIDLYLNCMELVNFDELKKKSAEFRDWKTKEREKLGEPGLRLALRYQLRWLMLTLEAASEKPDRVKLAMEAQETLDAIFRDADKLKYQQEILNQGVTGSVFAQAYDINNVKAEGWAMSPLQIDAIYDQILLPPYRRPSAVASLRSGWLKRIHQETVKMELWSEKRRERENRDDRGDRDDDRGDREEKKIGMKSAMQSKEYVKFIAEELPKLHWEMEVDLFRNGDQAGASMRMLALLERFAAHESAREWGEELKTLLTPVVPAVPKPADEVAP
jgi:hypothetical protein